MEQPNSAKNLSLLAPLIPLPLFLLLPLIVWFVSSGSPGWQNSLSAGAVLSSKYFLPFALLSALSVPLIVVLQPRLSAPKNSVAGAWKIPLFALSELPLVLGFALAFAGKNAYLFAPFFVLAALLYAFVYVHTRERLD